MRRWLEQDVKFLQQLQIKMGIKWRRTRGVTKIIKYLINLLSASLFSFPVEPAMIHSKYPGDNSGMRKVCPSNQSESSVHPIYISFFFLHLILQAQGLKCLREAKQKLNNKAAWKWKCKKKENCTLKFWIPLFSYEIWCFMLLFVCKSVFVFEFFLKLLFLLLMSFYFRTQTLIFKEQG